MEKKKETRSGRFYTMVGIIAMVFVLPAVIFSFIHPDDFDPIKYWCFYYPAYTLFGGGFYFPFYLDSFVSFAIFGSVIAIVVYSLVGIWKTRDRAKKSNYIWPFFGGIVMILLACLVFASIASDFTYVAKGQYCETEVDLAQLKRRARHGKKGTTYHLGRWELDVYQYRDLEEQQQSLTPGNRVKLKTYYLPKGRQVLKYEVVD